MFTYCVAVFVVKMVTINLFNSYSPYFKLALPLRDWYIFIPILIGGGQKTDDLFISFSNSNVN